MQELETTIDSRNPHYTTYIIIALLALIFIAQIVAIVGERGQAAEAEAARLEAENRRDALEEQAAEIRALVTIQNVLAGELFDSYEDAAYGPNVDRIAEQQLIATEYQILSMQIIVTQNQAIIELLSMPYLEVEGESDSGE